MSTKILLSVLTLWILSVALTSCSQDQNVEQSPVGTSADSYEHNRPMRDGSGSYRGRFPSGSGSMMMQKVSPEDRALFQQMREARRSGNTDLADKLAEQLRKKYPDFRFGSGGRREGSSMNTGSRTGN